MNYPDMSGFLEPRRTYSDPDMNGFERSNLPVGLRNTSGPDMSGFLAQVAGFNTGAYQVDPFIDGPVWSPLTWANTIGGNPIICGNGIVLNTAGGTATALIQRLDLRDPALTPAALTMPVTQEWKSGVADGKGTMALFTGVNSNSNVMVLSQENGRDGTWHNVGVSLPFSGKAYAAAIGGGRVVVLDFATTQVMWINSNGDWNSWTTAVLPAARNWRGIATNGRGTWAANADDTAIIYFSINNGESWAAGGSAAPSSVPIQYQGDYFVVAPNGTSNIWQSRDPSQNFVSSALPSVSNFGTAATRGVVACSNSGQPIVVDLQKLSGAPNNANARNQLPATGTWSLVAESGVFIGNILGSTTGAIGVF